MKLTKNFIIIMLILNIVLSILIFSGCFEEKRVEDGGKKFSIQQLIQNAPYGGIIYIPSGTYYENIKISKPLTLIGEIKNNTILDGRGGEQVIYVNADNVYIYNLTIRNSGGKKGDSGIKIISNNNLIKNCIIYRTKTGIYFDESKDNTISNCYFHTNGEGIYYHKSNFNLINNSEFQHNAFGINIIDSNKITIKNVYIHTNGLGVYARNIASLKITNSAISDNNQDGGGCWIYNSKGIEIDNCNIDHNGAGVKFKNTDGKITNSNFYFNMFISVNLINSEDTVVLNCDIKNSYRTAFKIQDSTCQIKQNNIENSMLNGFECDIKSICDIRENWWGNSFGPSFFEIGRGERITWILGKVKIYPWSKTIYQDAGSSWKTENIFTKSEYNYTRLKQITFNGQDSDYDGVPDWWENKWGYDISKPEDHENLDPDNDGLNNIEECYVDKYDSNPFYKDIFIEVDWLKSYDKDSTNKLSDDYILQAVEIFKQHDINLHIDTGKLGGGEQIAVSSTNTFADLRDLYWDYFLENDLDNPRKSIFHYALIMNENPETYEGFVFFGWDQLDALGLCIQPMQNNHKKMDRSKIIIFGIIHELGHQMGLLIDDFGGIDNTKTTVPFTFQFFKYLNYKSVLNYQKYYNILGYSDGSRGKNDFNDWKNLDFSFFKNTYLDLSI